MTNIGGMWSSSVKARTSSAFYDRGSTFAHPSFVTSAIYDHFHASGILEDYFLQSGRRDTFAQYETAMHLLQDTGEAL